MRSYFKFAVFILLVALSFSLPAPVQAQTTTPTATTATLPNCTTSMPVCDPHDCACINNQLQCAQMKQAQAKSDMLGAFFDSMPKIDLATYNCLGRIDQLLDMTNSPNLVGSFLDGIIDAFIGQVCNVALSAINQLQTYILSQANLLCIPRLSGAIGSLNLGLKPAVCNGTPLLTFSQSPGYGNSSPASWSMPFAQH